MNTKIAAITFNPSYDLVGTIETLKNGSVNQVETIGWHAAGKAINVAKVLSDLDLDVTLGGFLGQDNIEGFTSLFQQQSITNRCYAVKGRTRINVKLTESSKQVTDLNFTGFSVTESDWQAFCESSLAWLKEMDLICISGSLAKGIPLAAFSAWMQQVRSFCPRLVFDSSGAALQAGLKLNPWLIKPNQEELSQWAGKPLTCRDEIQAAAISLQQQGIEHVVVSLGSEGALWVTARGCWFAQPLSCNLLSTVGAGDSMVAGLIYALVKGYCIEEAMSFATAVAAQAIEQSGVGITNRIALETLQAKVKIQSVTTPRKDNV